MKQPIRAFSIGLFTSGIIFLIIYMVFGGLNNTKTEPSAEDMITSLEDEGYHVLTDSDYVSLSVQEDQETENADNQENDEDTGSEDVEENDTNADESAEDETDEDNEAADEDSDNGENEDNEATEDATDNDENEDEDDGEGQESTTYSLTINEGMASSEISSVLEDNNIIDDAEKFNRFLETEGYELKVQIGTYEVSNNMDYEEIAHIITN